MISYGFAFPVMSGRELNDGGELFSGLGPARALA